MKTYDKLTVNSKFLLKRFSHKMRFKIALDLLNPCSEDKILDYGTGDERMIQMIHSVNKSCTVVGYDPNLIVSEQFLKIIDDSNNIVLLNKINNCSEKSFNKICCLEVLEHLTEDNQKKEIHNMMRQLSDNGQLIISVPIETGVVSLFKNIVRILCGEKHKNTTFRNILFSVFSIHFNRGNESFLSHIGFYYKDLEKILLSSGLKICCKKFSPIPTLKNILNSQVFFLLKKK